MNETQEAIRDLQLMLANPFYCINIHPVMAQPHEPLVDEETWIKAAVMDIQERGEEAWLRDLLCALKHGDLTP